MRSHTRPPKTNTLHLSNIYCYLLFPLNDRLELMVMLGMMGPTTNGRQSEFSLVLLFSFLLHPHPHPYSSSPNARNDFSQRPFTRHLKHPRLRQYSQYNQPALKWGDVRFIKAALHWWHFTFSKHYDKINWSFSSSFSHIFAFYAVEPILYGWHVSNNWYLLRDYKLFCGGFDFSFRNFHLRNAWLNIIIS